MNLIFHATEDEGAELQFWELSCDLASEFPNHKIETCHSLDTLTKLLCHPSFERAVVVLLARNHANLSEILTIRALLDDNRVILILPDRSEATISQGHKLHPRYLSYAGGDFKDVAAVLRKMINHLDSQRIVLESPIPCHSNWVNLEHISFKTPSKIDSQKRNGRKHDGEENKDQKRQSAGIGSPNGELPDILPG